MSLATDVAALKTTVATSSAAIKAAFARKVQAAFLADNALLLGEMSRENLVALAAAATQTHASNQGNPHGTTAATLGMFTKQEIQNFVAALVPTGIIPLTQFGDPKIALPVVVTQATRNVTLPVGVPLFMAGGSYALPAFNYTFPDNTQTFFYARLVAGVAQYITSTVYVPESQTNTLIGVINVVNGVINKQTLNKVTRIDIYRLSTYAAGTAIPVSSGDPSATAALNWK